MSWQDIVLMVGNLALAIALLPSLRSKDKPHIYTSVGTGLILVSFTVVYASLELYLGAAVVAATALMWLILFWQKFRQKR